MDIKLKDILFNKITIFFVNFMVLLSYCYLDFNSTINSIINCTCIILFILFFILYIIRLKFSKFIIAFFIYCALLLMSSILGKDSNITSFFVSYYRIILLVIYTDWCIDVRGKEILLPMSISLFILTLINFMTIILYPNGLYISNPYTNNWFFRYDNTHIFMYLPAIYTTYLLYKCDEKKYKKLFYILISIVTFCVFYCFSATTVAAYFIFLMYLIFRKKINKIVLFNCKTYFFVYLFIFTKIWSLRASQKYQFNFHW